MRYEIPIVSNITSPRNIVVFFSIMTFASLIMKLTSPNITMKTAIHISIVCHIILLF